MLRFARKDNPIHDSNKKEKTQNTSQTSSKIQNEIKTLQSRLEKKDTIIESLNTQLKSYLENVQNLLTKIEDMELGMDSNLEAGLRMKTNLNELTERIYKDAYQNYLQKTELVSRSAYPVIKNVYENESNNYENIVVPFTDGKRTIQVESNNMRKP